MGPFFLMNLKSRYKFNQIQKIQLTNCPSEASKCEVYIVTLFVFQIRIPNKNLIPAPYRE